MGKVFNMVSSGGGGIKLASIDIQTPPAKTAYKAGETFNPAGMVVRATYSNGATMQATGYNFEPSVPLTLSDTSVTIRYSEGGVTKTATQAITVTKTALPVPSQSGSLTYNGGSQSPQWSNYDSSKMTLGGTTSGTNAGSYNATFTLKDTSIYEWVGGSTEAQISTWSIGKAAGSVTLDKSSITLNSGNPSDTITVTRLGDGAITATSSNTGVATVSISGNVVTVQSVNETSGNVTVTVNVAAGTNYTAVSAAVSVAAQFPITTTCVSVATSGTATVTDLNLYTPATIDSIAKKIAKSSAITSDTAEVYATLADGNVMKLSTNGASASQVVIPMNGADYAFDIIGFNHDEDDGGKVGITFQMHDLFTTAYPMKSSTTSADGWHNSDLRNSTMPLLMGYMPADWQNILVAVNKQTCQDVSTATLNTTKDKLFVPSEWEVFGRKTYAKAQEGTQYAYYKNSGTKVKKRNGSANEWWERSPRRWSGGYSYFCIVSSYGTSGNGSADGSFGAAPCFCLGSQFEPQTNLDDNDWTTISIASKMGIAANYWAVGDRKAVAINGTIGTRSINSTYYVYILGFNHNGATNTIDFGTFKTALTGGTDICLCDSKYNSNSSDGTKYFNLNHWSGINYGGWKGCDARYDVLGSTNQAPSGYGSTPTTSRVGYDATATTATSPVANTLMAALPADLRAIMKPMTIYTDNKGNSSNVSANVTTSVDYLPLLSEFEVFGARTNANQYEQNQQEQYQYYKNGNSKVKNKHNDTSTAAYWWERSPTYNYSNHFCIVYTSGTANHTIVSPSLGLAPAFRV